MGYSYGTGSFDEEALRSLVLIRYEASDLYVFVADAYASACRLSKLHDLSMEPPFYWECSH